jgi:hypothetical protein
MLLGVCPDCYESLQENELDIDEENQSTESFNHLGNRMLKWLVISFGLAFLIGMLSLFLG